jgi:uncharacterized protein
VKLRASGRGRHYSVGRALLESFLEAAYVGDWPARLWGVVPRVTQVSVTHQSIELPPGSGDRCRVAFVSDIHVGPTTPPALLENAFDTIRKAEPDVLLLGGDYVFLEAVPHRLALLRSLVESVPARLKLAVLGNHDLWTLDGEIVRALSSAGARGLINEASVLPYPWSDIVVVGLDDPWTGRCDPHAAASQIEGRPYRIVLCHSPDGLGVLADLRFDLYLAGHTHGGQIAAPWGPLVLPHGKMCSRFPAGFARFAEGVVYVSRGVGAVELPIRAFAPPDILVLDLVRPDASG